MKFVSFGITQDFRFLVFQTKKLDFKEFSSIENVFEQLSEDNAIKIFKDIILTLKF